MEDMNRTDRLNEAIEREAMFGTAPILKSEKIYGFVDAVLVLAGYVIATWAYTQGSYEITLVGFKQLLIAGFLGALLMLAIYQLPVILSVRYGIDIWIWLRTALGRKGVVVMTIAIIIVNWPWYAVCADLFGDSIINLFGLAGIDLAGGIWKVIFGLFCVALGTFIAYKGLEAITWTTRILVPLLLAVGFVVAYVAFSSVPFDVIWNYEPKDTGYAPESMTPYILAVEANFAYVITLVGGMAGIPRLTRTESSGYWAGVLSQGVAGTFFMVLGGIMAISTEYAVGEMIDDPTKMLVVLTGVPALAFCSLLLVAFANVGTQAVGCYLYGITLKSAFPNANYRVLIIIISSYVALLVIWGKIIDYFGTFLTIGGTIYAPIAAVLLVDFFFIRKQRIDLRSAYELSGHNAYEYTNGWNIVGMACMAIGIFLSLAVYNPVTGAVHIPFLFTFTPTGFSLLGTGIIYYLLCQIPSVRNYVLRDRDTLTRSA